MLGNMGKAGRGIPSHESSGGHGVLLVSSADMASIADTSLFILLGQGKDSDHPRVLVCVASDYQCV